MIRFEEGPHKYYDAQGKEYTSVTKVIEKYKQPFDSIYWSLYKALKDVYSERDLFGRLKYAAGGWEAVVSFWKKNQGWEGIPPEKIIKRQDWYLVKWANERDEACETGTAVHKELEDGVENEKEIITQHGIKLAVVCSTAEYADTPLEDGVYSEQKLWLPEERLAGTADRVEIHGNKIWVYDYKTNKKIDFQAFRNARMKPPLSSMPDCNFSHYTMQLSTYGYMLEKLTGKKVAGLYLDHVTTDTQFQVPYRRGLVQQMLKHYVHNS